jgi:LPXTG-motif cell wall-anchored protein
MITEKNQIALIWLGSIALVGVAGYFILKTTKKKPEVVVDVIDEELGTTPKPAPAPRPNPFTALLDKKFAPIDFKPTDYSVKNPFADVNTAIASVNPFSSSTNTGERLA